MRIWSVPTVQVASNKWGGNLPLCHDGCTLSSLLFGITISVSDSPEIPWLYHSPSSLALGAVGAVRAVRGRAEREESDIRSSPPCHV